MHNVRREVAILAKHFLIALMAGFGASVVLFFSAYASPSLFWPQVVGFWLCMVLCGVHASTKVDMALIGIPTNALIYATVIFLLLHAFRILFPATPDAGLRTERC